MKTKVEILEDAHPFKKGDEGYIDGYLLSCGSDCAVVIVDDSIATVPLSFLKAIPETSNIEYQIPHNYPEEKIDHVNEKTKYSPF